MCLLLSSFGILSIRERIWLNDYYMCLKLFRCYPIWSVSSSCHHIHRCIFNSRITRINEDSHIFFFFSFEFHLNPNRYLIKLRHSSCAPLWSHWTTNDKDKDLTRLHIIRQAHSMVSMYFCVEKRNSEFVEKMDNIQMVSPFLMCFFPPIFISRKKNAPPS